MNGLHKREAHLFYWYAYGYKSRAEATEALEDMFADGEVSGACFPRIEAYKNKNNETRFGVMLRGND